jgi:hypothetical protein
VPVGGLRFFWIGADSGPSNIGYPHFPGVELARGSCCGLRQQETSIGGALIGWLQLRFIPAGWQLPTMDIEPLCQFQDSHCHMVSWLA